LPRGGSPGRSGTIRPNYSWRVLGLTGGDPSFRGDDGGADVAVTAALAAFAAGEAGEVGVLAALARSRLLVPVVAVLAEQLDPGQAESHGPPPACPPGLLSARQEKASEMAMPTLIGLDGRRAIPAFTSLESMRLWRSEARPVPVAAGQVWAAAVAEGCAVVVDVGGPVPVAVEGARLAALARGDEPPPPFGDPDVHEVVADVLAGQLAVTSFELRAPDADGDLVIALTIAPGHAASSGTELAAEIGNAVMARLGGRLRRGVGIWLAVAGPAGPGADGPGRGG